MGDGKSRHNGKCPLGFPQPGEVSFHLANRRTNSIKSGFHCSTTPLNYFFNSL
jgi:hypothetical protein